MKIIRPSWFFVSPGLSWTTQWALEQCNGLSEGVRPFRRADQNFRRAWQTACTSSGGPDLEFHDLRRTVVRNMRRARVSQVARSRITGHRTDSMERRYNIVDVEDPQAAKNSMERSEDWFVADSWPESTVFRRLCFAARTAEYS